MERASIAFFEAFVQQFHEPCSVSVFCGTGNNGGDGLVIARLLHHAGWNVDAYLVEFSTNFSPDKQTNQKRLNECGLDLICIKTLCDFPETNEIIIDTLFGTGLTRELDGFAGEIVKKNSCDAIVCSVDLPSGFYSEGNCIEQIDSIIHAD